jgi:DNA-3-methyladenine glycosylase II
VSDEGEEVVWREATERLLADPAFGPVVAEVGPVRLRGERREPFASLALAIVSQQLAGSAVRAIHGRFVDALGGRVTPAGVLATPEDVLRACGLSRSKLVALRDLAGRVEGGTLTLTDLPERGDADIVERLTVVKGVGRWTAEMYLLFSLRRPDIWPVGDLGVRTGLGILLGWETTPTPREAELIGVGYRPSRSAAAWYCWRAVEARSR